MSSASDRCLVKWGFSHRGLLGFLSPVMEVDELEISASTRIEIPGCRNPVHRSETRDKFLGGRCNPGMVSPVLSLSTKSRVMFPVLTPFSQKGDISAQWAWLKQIGFQSLLTLLF